MDLRIAVVFVLSNSGSWDLCGFRIKRFWILGSLWFSYYAILDLGISVVSVLSDSGSWDLCSFRIKRFWNLGSLWLSY